MKPQSKRFQFLFPLNRKCVRDLQIVTEHITDLNVEGVAYFDPYVPSLSDNRYSADVDTVEFKGMNIYALLTADLCSNILEEIETAATAHACYLFNQQPFIAYTL